MGLAGARRVPTYRVFNIATSMHPPLTWLFPEDSAAAAAAPRPVLRLDDVQAEILQWEYWELVSPTGPLPASSSANPDPGVHCQQGCPPRGGASAVPTDFLGIESYTDTFK